MAKNGHFVLSVVTKTAFSGITTPFYVKLACKIILTQIVIINPYLAKFGHNMAKMVILS